MVAGREDVVVLKGRKPKTGRPGEHLTPVNLAETAASLNANRRGREPHRLDELSDVSASLSCLRSNPSALRGCQCAAHPQFYYGMRPGEEISVELEPAKHLSSVSHCGRTAT